MKPVIKSYDCTDMDDDLETWQPVDPEYADLWINFTIGTDDEEAADHFLAHVVTPKALNDHRDKKFAVVLNEYSWEALMNEIANILKKCEGEDWIEVSGKLSQYLKWEYAGMK